MPEIFHALPGLEVPVGAISQELARWWQVSAADGRPSFTVDDARATQINFVLHFGLNTTPEDAAVQFATVVRLAHQCPARVVVLCPRHADVPEPEIHAKVYGECFLGRSPADKRCVEFVMLSYSRSARRFLENQVSICLSADLPLYYWAHRFSQSARLADYRYLLTHSRRVMIDSAVAPPDVLTYPWPNPAATRDLAFCRLLPVRQSLGQFLAAYPPEELASGLRSVSVMHRTTLAAEARVLLPWLRARLGACGAGETVQYAAVAGACEAEGDLGVTLAYADGGRYFRWRGHLATGRARFEADFGRGPTLLASGVSLLAPEQALSEAMFF